MSFVRPPARITRWLRDWRVWCGLGTLMLLMVVASYLLQPDPMQGTTNTWQPATPVMVISHYFRWSLLRI